MSNPMSRERMLVRYVLGDLRAADRADLDERLFHDDALHEDLLATADDLIHDYLSGACSADDRKRFESHFLRSPVNRERFQFVRDLRMAVGRVPLKSSGVAAQATARLSRWRGSLAAAVASVGLAILALPDRSGRLLDDTEDGQVSRTTEVTLTGEAPALRLPDAPSAAPLRVAISREARIVHLELEVRDERSPTFIANIQRVRGGDVWREEDLAPSAAGAPLHLSVPAALLTVGEYVLVVQGEVLRDLPPPSPSLRVYRLRVVPTSAAGAASERQSP